MHSTTSIAAARHAAFNSAPRRLARVVRLGATLGLTGIDYAGAVEEIESAIWGDGALPADRPSQRRAWELTLERALYAYEHAPDAFEIAEQRAHRAAPSLLDALPADASLEDFAAALTVAEPLLNERRAMRLARGVATSLARSPIVQRGPGLGPDPFAERRTFPREHEITRQRRALRIIGVEPMGNLAGLQLATFMGEPVQPSSAHEACDEPQAETGALEEWRPRNIADPAMWSDLASMPPSLRGLAYVDFDPSFDTSPPAWLAKGLLPSTGIGLLFGESGAGKSFAAIHSALAVAWGLPLFGAKTKRGAVLYIAAEGGKSVLRRFKAANRALDGVVAAANIARPRGTAPLTRAPIRVVHEAPDLSRDGDCASLVRTIRNAAAEFEAAGDRLVLVVVDTWHAALGGGDENSAADAGHALKPLIAESEHGGFLTLIVHHPGKDSDRGARGSNALPAAADAIIAITVPGFEGAKAKPSSAMRQATVTKMRDGEAGIGFNYRLTIVSTGIDEDGEDITTCVVEPCDPPKLDENGLSSADRDFMDGVAAALHEGNTGRARAEEVRLRFYAMRPEATADARRMAWQRALKRAIASGRVATDDHDMFIWLPERETQP